MHMDSVGFSTPPSCVICGMRSGQVKKAHVHTCVYRANSEGTLAPYRESGFGLVMSRALKCARRSTWLRCSSVATPADNSSKRRQQAARGQRRVAAGDADVYQCWKSDEPLSSSNAARWRRRRPRRR